MPEGVAPHASVIFALGHIAVANMSSFHPYSVNVFKYLLSILQVTKSDNMRKLYAQSKYLRFFVQTKTVIRRVVFDTINILIAVSQLVETVVEQISIEELSVTKEQYSPIIEEIFDTFMTTWLQSKDPSVSVTSDLIVF